MLLKLLRGTPELIRQVERLAAVLTAAAGIMAIELQASDVNRLHGLLSDSYEPREHDGERREKPGRNPGRGGRRRGGRAENQ